MHFAHGDEISTPAADTTVVLIPGGWNFKWMMTEAVGVVATVEKIRTCYILDGRVKVYVDEVRGLGRFILLGFERRASEDREGAKAEIVAAMAALGIPPGAVVNKSYREMVTPTKPVPTVL